jgi:thymidylate kinase
MLIKIFVLGRPGSGKTTAFRRISAIIKDKGWPVTRIRDYGILQSMSRDAIEGKKFRPTDHGGFDVVDFSVLDNALVEVERQVKLRMLTAREKELVVVEFARSDYKTGLEPFSPEFLQDVHMLFIDADVETCIQRVHQRVAKGLAPDSHFVSDHILRGYYGNDNRSYMKYLAELSAEARRGEKSTMGVVQCIENTGSLDDFHTAIDDFIITFVEQEEGAWNLKEIPGFPGFLKKNEFINR